MVLIAIVTALLAQAPAKKPIETAHLTVTTAAGAAAVARGGRLTLFADVVPKPDMHVYAPGQEGYIAIVLTLDADPTLVPAKAKYPAGEKYVMPALNETMLVYQKPFRIAQDVTIKAASGGIKTIKGTLRYQACDDKICYLPKTIPVEWTIDIR